MSQLLEILQAIDRLNSWVRSPGYRRGFSGAGLRRRVYVIKRAAIERAHKEFACTHRPLTTLVTCRDCGGSGEYYDWNGKTHPHCWKCESKGVIRLPFVETKIFDPRARVEDMPAPLFVWHSPRDRWPLSEIVLGPEVSRGDWDVNLPGRDMPVDDAARDLLLCDAAFPRATGYCCSRCDCERHYTLYLGNVDDQCGHCGAAVTQEWANGHRGGKTIGRVEFSFVVCPACDPKLRSTSQWFGVEIPERLLTPNVREWWERHGMDVCREERAA